MYKVSEHSPPITFSVVFIISFPLCPFTILRWFVVPKQHLYTVAGEWEHSCLDSPTFCLSWLMRSSVLKLILGIRRSNMMLSLSPEIENIKFNAIFYHDSQYSANSEIVAFSLEFGFLFAASHKFKRQYWMIIFDWRNQKPTSYRKECLSS